MQLQLRTKNHLNTFPHTANMQQKNLNTSLFLFFWKLPLNESTIMNRDQNMVTKGEIALFCPHVFKNTSAAEASKSVYMMEMGKYQM